MKATVVIEKSFDDAMEFSKEWEAGDLEEFLSKEGKYCDSLCEIMSDKATDGDSFTVTYTVTVTK